MASVALALLVAGALFSIDRDEPQQIMAAQPQTSFVLPDDGVPSFMAPDVLPQAVHSVASLDAIMSDQALEPANQDAVLANLATYREQ